VKARRSSNQAICGVKYRDRDLLCRKVARTPGGFAQIAMLPFFTSSFDTCLCTGGDGVALIPGAADTACPTARS